MSSESEPEDLEDLDDLNDIKHEEENLNDLDKIITDVKSKDSILYLIRGRLYTKTKSKNTIKLRSWFCTKT